MSSFFVALTSFFSLERGAVTFAHTTITSKKPSYSWWGVPAVCSAFYGILVGIMGGVTSSCSLLPSMMRHTRNMKKKAVLRAARNWGPFYWFAGQRWTYWPARTDCCCNYWNGRICVWVISFSNLPPTTPLTAFSPSATTTSNPYRLPFLTCISTESEAIAFDKIEMLLLDGADMLLNGISSE